MRLISVKWGQVLSLGVRARLYAVKDGALAERVVDAIHGIVTFDSGQ